MGIDQQQAVAALPAHGLAGQRPLLPARVVGVLEGDLRQQGRDPGDLGGVGGAQLAHQQAERPAVVDQVVLDQDELVKGRAEPDRRPPHQRQLAEVERGGHVADDQ
ncbi:MAG TPA: hypothetical protein VHE80_00935, partial [Acidimicrobiales bacterium]|nr:hypothetical protein [Acidimicrobiales bacterium]